MTKGLRLAARINFDATRKISTLARRTEFFRLAEPPDKIISIYSPPSSSELYEVIKTISRRSLCCAG